MSITDDSCQVYMELSELFPTMLGLLVDLERAVHEQKHAHQELVEGLRRVVPALHRIRQALLETEDWELYVLIHTAWSRTHNVVTWLERNTAGAQLDYEALVNDVQAVHLALEQIGETLSRREA